LGLIAVLARLLALLLARSDQDARPAQFLAAWLAIEIIGCLVISPFPAARRCMGILFVVLLIIFHGVRKQLRTAPENIRFVAPVAALLIADGLGLWAIGYVDAINIRNLSELVATKARELTASGKQAWIWAPHAAAFYASQAGLSLVDGDTLLEPGDVFVSFPAGFEVKWDLSAMEPVASLSAGINLGATTTLIYFAGKRPISGAPDTRPVAAIYRVHDASRLRALPDNPPGKI
jgi:hypothetical protein